MTGAPSGAGTVILGKVRATHLLGGLTERLRRTATPFLLPASLYFSNGIGPARSSRVCSPQTRPLTVL